jgi:hypothetical protein
VLALISHHALVRLVQRYAARTADDLVAAARRVWDVVYQEAGSGDLDAFYKPPPQGWRVPLTDGGALVLGPHEDGTLVLKTILGPGMVDSIVV